jgi:hypothetical protein
MCNALHDNARLPGFFKGRLKEPSFELTKPRWPEYIGAEDQLRKPWNYKQK